MRFPASLGPTSSACRQHIDRLLLALPVALFACGAAASPSALPSSPTLASLLDATDGSTPVADDDSKPREAINPRLLRRFRRVANEADSAPPPSPEQVSLGRQLWFDPRISNDGAISCNSCHELAAYGVEGRPTSLGDGGRLGRRNPPTVYNTSEHFALFWDGRAHDAAQQALVPILDPSEMASTRIRVEAFHIVPQVMPAVAAEGG